MLHGRAVCDGECHSIISGIARVAIFASKGIMTMLDPPPASGVEDEDGKDEQPE
jgi:hypothetical protein